MPGSCPMCRSRTFPVETICKVPHRHLISSQPRLRPRFPFKHSKDFPDSLEKAIWIQKGRYSSVNVPSEALIISTTTDKLSNVDAFWSCFLSSLFEHAREQGLRVSVAALVFKEFFQSLFATVISIASLKIQNEQALSWTLTISFAQAFQKWPVSELCSILCLKDAFLYLIHQPCPQQ